jgi:hypothetical protein
MDQDVIKQVKKWPPWKTAGRCLMLEEAVRDWLRGVKPARRAE